MRYHDDHHTTAPTPPAPSAVSGPVLAPDPARWEEAYDAPPAPPQYADGTPTHHDPEDTGTADHDDTDTAETGSEVVAGYAPAPSAPVAGTAPVSDPPGDAPGSPLGDGAGLNQQGGGGVAPVAVPATAGEGTTTGAAGVRRQVVPDWAKTARGWRAHLGWWVVCWLSAAGFHLVRCPLYVVRLWCRSPRGVARVGLWAVAWITAGAGVAHASAEATAAHARQVKQRIWLVAVAVGVVVAPGVVLVANTPVAAVVWWAPILAVVGVAGAKDDEDRVLDRRGDGSAVIPIDREAVTVALAGTGIPKLRPVTGTGVDSTPPVIRDLVFVDPIVRDGDGWRVVVDLPRGVAAADVIARCEALASGLRRRTDCVWPTGDDAHAGRLVLFVADTPLAQIGAYAWPWANEIKKRSFFDPFPFGIDERGNPVSTRLMFASGVCGARPRRGKTFAMRLVALAAACDPRVQLTLVDLKGGADWRGLGDAVAHRLIIGGADEDIAKLLAVLKEAKADMEHRYAVIRGLSTAECPEGQLTDDLADRRGLHPVLIVIDECQLAFEHGEHGKEITALCEDLVRRGPAAGVVVILATQRVDATSIPKGISSNASWRFCLQVASHVENDLVLGTGAYSRGVNAAGFADTDKGIGWLIGSGAPRIVKTALVDNRTAEHLAAKLRQLRQRAGRLTGHAAGEDTTPDAEPSVIEHLAACWPTGDTKLWCAEIAAILAETYPSVYGGWEAAAVAPALRPFGITTRSVKGEGGAVKRGIRRDDLDAALTTHGKDSGGGTPPPPVTDCDTTGSEEGAR